MRRSLFALLLLVSVSPPPASAAERLTTITDFLEPGGRVRVIAHRGFSAVAPENTLAAVRAAIEVGADMAEIDVTLSADGHVVVIHDETLDRTTDGRGEVADFRLAELKTLDAGAWFGPRFTGERIPTLDEVLAEVRGRILLNVEIKSEAVGRGIVDEVAAAVQVRRMSDRVIVSSFSPTALEAMRTAGPDIRTAVLFNPEVHRGSDPVDIVRSLGASAFNIKRARLTGRTLRRCLDNAVPVAVYTVNSPRRMRKLMRRGVHAVFTDHPGRMVEVVRRSVAAAPSVLPSPDLEPIAP